ncbi:hypothetical protein GCM10023325_11550 [Sphingomonas lutea]
MKIPLVNKKVGVGACPFGRIFVKIVSECGALKQKGRDVRVGKRLQQWSEHRRVLELPHGLITCVRADLLAKLRRPIRDKIIADHFRPDTMIGEVL